MAKRRRPEPPGIRHKVPEEQIPWATDVVVDRILPDRVVLKRGPGATATVHKNGSVDLEFFSESLISEFMFHDLGRSYEIERKYFQDPGAFWEWLRHWAEPPPSITFSGGSLVSEWPGGESRPPRRFGEHKMDDTENWARWYYKGSRFRFAHFKTEEGEEGAVIQWIDPRTGEFGPPEVRMGDFVAFMRVQSLVEPDSPEEWIHWNEEFENTFMWALERLGSFDQPGTLGIGALLAIAEDPEALLTESVAKILARIDEYPEPPELREEIIATAEGRGLTPSPPEELSGQNIIVMGADGRRWRIDPAGVKQNVEEYLKTHDLAHDSRVYTQDEWRARGEKCGNDAVVTITTEGPLYALLNRGDWEGAAEEIEDFNKFLEFMGFYWDLGYAWSVHLYPIQENP